MGRFVNRLRQPQRLVPVPQVGTVRRQTEAAPREVAHLAGVAEGAAGAADVRPRGTEGRLGPTGVRCRGGPVLPGLVADAQHILTRHVRLVPHDLKDLVDVAEWRAHIEAVEIGMARGTAAELEIDRISEVGLGDLTEHRLDGGRVSTKTVQEIEGMHALADQHGARGGTDAPDVRIRPYSHDRRYRYALLSVYLWGEGSPRQPSSASLAAPVSPTAC